jgi:hypothetical protein
VSEALRPEPDPYWTDDRALTTVRLGHAAYDVAIRSHAAHERSTGAGGESLFALQQSHGERVYLQSRLYIPSLPATGHEHRLADGQAWHYPAEAATVLWELLPAGIWWRPDPDPREDFLLRRLWLAYERFLVDRFPAATRLLTTYEDTYDRGDWQGFLTTLGYRQTAPAGFTKILAPT